MLSERNVRAKLVLPRRGSGPRGRGFKSRRLDQKTDRNFPVCFLLNVFRRDLRVEVRTGVSSLRIAAQKHRAGKQTAQRGALCSGARRQRRKSRRLDQIPRRDSFSAGDLFVAMEHECMTSCVPLPSALTPPGSPKRAQHFLGKRSGGQQGSVLSERNVRAKLVLPRRGSGPRGRGTGVSNPLSFTTVRPSFPRSANGHSPKAFRIPPPTWERASGR